MRFKSSGRDLSYIRRLDIVFDKEHYKLLYCYSLDKPLKFYGELFLFSFFAGTFV
jgi:hypothetical protein